MPRNDDRHRGGRPPGGGRAGRGGPPRGKRFSAGDKRAGDDRPREPRKLGGRAFRKAHGEAPRGEGRDQRPRGKRFDAAKSGERRFGERSRFDDRRDGRDKRGFGSKPGGGFRRDDRRPRPDRATDERRSGAGARRGERAWQDHPRSDGAPREQRRPYRQRDDRPPRDDRAPRREHDRRPRSSDRGEQGQSEERPARPFQSRPAFGGRGAYRERKPFSPRDTRARREAPPLPKKSGERVAKLIARAGLCSRREAEEWVRQGRVAVNGRVIDSPALDVNARDIVAVDGAPLPQRERTRLFLYHKPRGLVTSHADPEGRRTIFDTLPKNLPRLISIGRLDYNTEGLLLLTNDGGLKRVLELPDTGWLRRYRVRAHGAITQERLNGLRDGIEVDGVKYGPIEATLDSEQGANVWISFAIREGKNREVRNVLSHLGLEVNRLIRVSYGPFQLGELGEGEVSEVRGRMLRDQLGERIAKEAGADFSLPLRDHATGAEDDVPAERPRETHVREQRAADERPRQGDRTSKPKPRGRAGLIADSKGRRVLVQRVGGGEPREDERRPRNGFKPRRPPGRYKGKRDRAPRDE